jgi:N6-adenosine-specific RNA methylase IME4
VSTSYATLLLDPPWLERGAGQVKRGADRHYPLLKTHAMPPVIFGLWLMDVLGFRYVTNVVWAKQRVGLGQYFRGQHELLLFGVRKGASQPTLFRSERKNIPSLLNADRGKHSAKPVEAYELIEARSTCPEGLGRLEMFARSERPGWTSWGNEL